MAPRFCTIIRGARRKGNRKRRSHAKGELPHSLEPPYDNRKIDRFIILIKCEIALKEVPLTPGSEAVSIVAHESEYIAEAMKSLYIPLPPVVQNCQIG